MINKQSVWFVTLFSLIIVLAIYYVTLNDSSLQNILNMSEKEKETKKMKTSKKKWKIINQFFLILPKLVKKKIMLIIH